MRLFHFLQLLRCQAADPRARTQSDLVHPSLWSTRRKDSPSAFCLPESASGRPSRHCIYKRHTTSLLIRPCCFGNIPRQHFHDVSASEPALLNFFKRKLVYLFLASPDELER